MRALALIIFALTLTACSQRDQCERRATTDLRVLTSLIAETQANLTRGYGLQEIERPVERRYTCKVRQPDGTMLTQICTGIDMRTERKPVAIDLDAEAAKLRSLKARQIQMKDQAAEALAQCAKLE